MKMKDMHRSNSPPHKPSRIQKQTGVQDELVTKRAALELSIDAIAMSDMKGRVTYVNSAFCKLWGYSPEEVLGRSAASFVERPEIVARAFEKLQRSGGWRGELTARRSDGSTFDVMLSATLVRKNETAGVMMAVFHDITERKQMEEVLRESEDRYRTLFDSTNDAIFIHDMGGKFLEANQVACERLGYSREELLQMTPADIDSPEYAVTIPQRLEELREVGHSLSEIAQVTRDGIMIPTELSSRIIDYKGTQAVLSIARDITQRKRLEAAVRESEERFRGIAENSVDIVYSTDLEGRLKYVSPSTERILGYKPEDFIEKPFLSYVPESEIPKAAQALTRLAKEGSKVEGLQLQMRRRDGSLVDLEINASPMLKHGELVGIQGIVRDITERKRMEAKLHEYASHLEELVEERTQKLAVRR
jgi:PAS domain S-box-containing protein